VFRDSIPLRKRIAQLRGIPGITVFLVVFVAFACPAIPSWAGAPPDHPETWEDPRNGAAGRLGWPSDEDGRASVTVEPSSGWVAGSLMECRVTFRVEDVPIGPGGGVRVGFRRGSDAGPFQTSDPAGEGYVTAWAGSGGELDSEALEVLAACGYVQPAADRLNVELFPTEVKVLDRQGSPPWPRAIEVRLPRGLPVGGDVVVVIGDRSKGGPGFRVQTFSERTSMLRPYTDGDGDGVFRPIQDPLPVRVVGGDGVRFHLSAPALVPAGDEFAIVIRAEDEYWNTARRYTGEIEIEILELAGVEFGQEMPETGMRTYSVHQASKVYGWKLEDDRWVGGRSELGHARVNSPGLYALRVTGSLESPILPLVVVEKPASGASWRLYWGDFHGHTELSDGAGTVEDYFDFARYEAGLDIGAATDHDWLLSDPDWESLVSAADGAYEPGRFVTFAAYEWSEHSAAGGDHNVYYVSGTPEIFRCSRSIRPDTRTLAHLSRAIGERNVLLIPHVGGRRANWDRVDPERLSVCEIASVHGWNESFGVEGLKKDHLVGFIGSSDSHTGHPGRAHPAPPTFAVKPGGLAGVWATELTRQGIARAVRDRRTLATTGERIFMDVRVAGEMMGSEVNARAGVEVVARVAGTALIESVEIQRGSQTVYRAEPRSMAFTLRWTDPQPESERTPYYIRVTQTDGHMAWSSPVWVNPF